MISYELDSAVDCELDRVLKHSDFHRERMSTTTLTMPIYTSMTREYSLSAGRSLVDKKMGNVYSIMIFEMGFDNRHLEFFLIRWSSFTRAIDEIDNAVKDFKINQLLKYYIGGGYYVSVTAGYWCVDIR